MSFQQSQLLTDFSPLVIWLFFLCSILVYPEIFQPDSGQKFSSILASIRLSSRKIVCIVDTNYYNCFKIKAKDGK